MLSSGNKNNGANSNNPASADIMISKNANKTSQVQATIEDDDYIEEDFEEDKSDSPIEEDPDGSDAEEERLELERLE